MEENASPALPPAKNPLTAQEAEKYIALLNENLASYEAEEARCQVLGAQAHAMAMKIRCDIADIRRRAANVDFPEPPKKEEAPKAEPEGK